MNSPIKLPDMSWSLIEALPEDAVTGVFIYAAQAVREALAARDEWMPIETAPEREAILVYGGIWQSEINDSCSAAESISLVSKIDGRFEEMGGTYYSTWVKNPTHWMPLPAPPKENNHGDTP